MLRFDNEAGKGDHMHLEQVEQPYRFESMAQLLADFWSAIERWEGR